MITSHELKHIKEHAYIPEHIPEYVTAISEAEPYLTDGFLYYKKKGILIFIGYPLQGVFDENRMADVLKMAIKVHTPEDVSIIAPHFKLEHHITCIENGSDIYYRLDLHRSMIPQKVRHMIKRASTHIAVNISSSMNKEHIDLINAFLVCRKFDENTSYIFNRITEYISKSKGALIIEARNKSGILCGFDIGEFDAANYAFYMFNITSNTYYVPGLSDLLLWNLIEYARHMEKRYVNFGLGINKGVRFFKEKWGAVPFLNYSYFRYKRASKLRFCNMLKTLFFE